MLASAPVWILIPLGIFYLAFLVFFFTALYGFMVMLSLEDKCGDLAGQKAGRKVGRKTLALYRAIAKKQRHPDVCMMRKFICGALDHWQDDVLCRHLLQCVGCMNLWLDEGPKIVTIRHNGKVYR